MVTEGSRGSDQRRGASYQNVTASHIRPPLQAVGDRWHLAFPAAISHDECPWWPSIGAVRESSSEQTLEDK